MAEGARLESVYTATYREFESLPDRHIEKTPSACTRGFFVMALSIDEMQWSKSAIVNYVYLIDKGKVRNNGWQSLIPSVN